eukprot:645477-Rhodomonas_salina.3
MTHGIRDYADMDRALTQENLIPCKTQPIKQADISTVPAGRSRSSSSNGSRGSRGNRKKRGGRVSEKKKSSVFLKPFNNKRRRTLLYSVII